MCARLRCIYIYVLSTHLDGIIRNFIRQKNNLTTHNEDQNSHNIIILTFWHHASIRYKTDGMTSADSSCGVNCWSKRLCNGCSSSALPDRFIRLTIFDPIFDRFYVTLNKVLATRSNDIPAAIRIVHPLLVDFQLTRRVQKAHKTIVEIIITNYCFVSFRVANYSSPGIFYILHN